MSDDIFANIGKIEEELQKQLEAEEPAAPVEQEPEQPEEPAQPEAEPESEEHEDDVTPEDVNNPDTKKRNSAWGRMRAEQRELREKLDAEAKEKQELRERLARLEGRTDAMAKPEAKQENADNEPDKDMYPEDHLAWKQRQFEKRLNDFEQKSSRFEQDVQVQRAQKAVEVMENNFKSANPNDDYDGAVKHLIDREVALKKLANPNITDEQARGQIQFEKMQLFAKLHAEGRNPAQFIYETAKIQGYTPGAKPVQTKPKVDLQRVADNQRRASNLIGGSAASPNNGSKLSAEQVLGLSMMEQAKLYAKNPKMFDEAVEG